MSTLLTAAFSTLKGMAIAFAVVNLAVFAAALICLYFLYKPSKKKEEEKSSDFLKPLK